MIKVLLIWGVSGLLTGFVAAQEAQPPANPEADEPSPQSPAADSPESAEEYEDTSKITDLPLLEDLEIPSAQELLEGEEISWIIVVNDRVVFSRAISPRPNTLQRQAEEYETLRKQGTPSDPREAAEFRNRIYRLRRVRGGFPGSSQFPEFFIQVKDVKEIWHHEDLMLKRADLLMEVGKLNEAYELLFTLQTINSNWPGLEAHHCKLMFLDADALWKNGEQEAALARYEELYRINPDYPELLNRLSDCTHQLIDSAVAAEQFRRARHFLHRLKAIRSNLSVVREWSDQLQSLMQDTLQAALTANQQGDFPKAVALVERAAVIWPDSIELHDQYGQLCRRYQILKVGVLRPTGSRTGYPFSCPPEERSDYLASRPLFEISRYDDSPRYRSRWIEHWEPTELGRNLVMQLRTDFDYSSSQKPLTANEVARTLSRQINPDSEDYDERLSGYLHTVRVHSPYRLELEFARAPLRPEALLNRPVRGSTGSTSAHEWFQQRDRTDRSCSWERAVPEPDVSPVFHIAEVREIGYGVHEEAVRALFRREVDYLPALPLQHVTSLRESQPWIVRKYAIPETHLLQFHPRSLPSKSSELRRALLYALDREEILSEEVLRETPREFGRLTTSPVPTKSESYSPLIKPLEPNLRVALSLALAAAKTNGGELPALKMIVPPDEELKPVYDRLIKRWQRIGVDVVIVDPADGDKDTWDIVYRRVSLSEPLTQLWPLLTMQSTSRVADLQNLPGWLRQELIRLDLTTNWDDANTILFRLHEHLWSEVFYLPLWELDRYSIARRSVHGMPSDPLFPYQNLTSWILDPSFDQTPP